MELDALVDIERRRDIDRRLSSLKRMKNTSEQRYNSYVEMMKNPQNRHMSVGVTAALGTTGGSPQKFNTFQRSSLPELLGSPEKSIKIDKLMAHEVRLK